MSNLDRTLNGYRYVQILQGDTLQRIALRELKDASRWPDLITINALSFPYIASNGSDGVKAYGDSILVPAAVATVDATVDPDEVFGIDLALNDGKLTDDGAGDFSLVRGADNLKQALENRVETNPGELVFHGEYGCLVARIKGAVNGPTAAQLGAEYVKSAMLSDPRVLQVPESIATVSGDALEINAEVNPIVGAPLKISASV